MPAKLSLWLQWQECGVRMGHGGVVPRFILTDGFDNSAKYLAPKLYTFSGCSLRISRTKSCTYTQVSQCQSRKQGLFTQG
jgi:hypothetical protein